MLVYDVGNNTITELATGSGQCVGATLGSVYQFDRPGAMAVADGHLFVGG